MSETEAGAMSSEQPRPQTPTDSSPETEADVTERSSYLDGLNEDLLRRPGDRQSNNMDVFVIEAQLVADGRDLDNPATPIATDRNGEIENGSPEWHDDVLQTLERKGLQPAWRVVDDA